MNALPKAVFSLPTLNCGMSDGNCGKCCLVLGCIDVGRDCRDASSTCRAVGSPNCCGWVRCGSHGRDQSIKQFQLIFSTTTSSNIGLLSIVGGSRDLVNKQTPHSGKARDLSVKDGSVPLVQLEPKYPSKRLHVKLANASR